MLIADTQIRRTTVDTTARTILEPTELLCERKVQVLLPDDQLVYIGVDVEPTDIGPNRTYKLAPVTGGQRVAFRLARHQRLIAASDRGTVSFTLIIEHHRKET